MSRNNILDIEKEFEKRKMIYDYVLKYPGLHNREISRKLNIPRTTLQYHLNFLMKKGFVNEKDDGIYSRYFPSEKILDIEKELFSIFRKRINRSILYILSYHRVLTQKDIVKYLKEDFSFN